ncbi:MAG: hypothetical protein GKR96_10735 [Gammaproteobacteria bacterium]|nr:hypothetical protein [Gammaproteobacteria bacterium]
MRTSFVSLSFAVLLVITGCSDNHTTSSGSGSNMDINLGRSDLSVPTAEGGMIYVSYEGSGTAGNPVVLEVKIRDANNTPLPGTVHWQDNTDDRVFNGTVLTHVYEVPGEYRIAIVPDGGEKVVVTPGGSNFSISSSTTEATPAANATTLSGCSRVFPNTDSISAASTKTVSTFLGSGSHELIYSILCGSTAVVTSAPVSTTLPEVEFVLGGPADSKTPGCSASDGTFSIKAESSTTGEIAMCTWTIIDPL